MTTLGGTHRAYHQRSAVDMAAVTDDNAETQVGRMIEPQPNGCWLFKGRPDDYGDATVGGTRIRAHRFVYETLVGPIPDGHVVHHECETPGCCNPEHLTPLTIGDHNRRHAEMKRHRGV